MVLKNRVRLGWLCLALLLAAPILHSQEASPSSDDEDSTSVATPQPQTLEQKPPSPPQVTCKDGLLKIDASNSTLGAVLNAVSACTGIEMEVPESAVSERLFANLGPGPVRQVLASLLSSTDLNYLIQSAESDPQKLQTVLLMARTTRDSGTSTIANMSPARRGWQQARRNTTEATANQPEESSHITNTVEAAAASPAEAPAAEVAAPTPEIAASEDPVTPVETAAVHTETPATTPASTFSPTLSNSTQGLIENMRRLFEERRKLQQQEKANPK